MVDKPTQTIGTTDLSQVKLNPPKCSEDIEFLMATISAAENAKKELNATIKKIGAISQIAENYLLTYFTEKLEEDPDYNEEFQSGKFNKRTAAKWIYEDEDKLLTELKLKHPNLVRTKVIEEVDKVELKKAMMVADDGTVLDDSFEPIDGVKVVRETSYSVTVGK